MSVGKTSLLRASNGLKTQTVDEKAVLENVICEAVIESIVCAKKKADEKLVESIRKYGLVCPIVAVKDGEKLVVIDGAKRLAAFVKLGAKTIKTVVVNGDAAALKKELATFKPKAEKTKAETPASAKVKEEPSAETSDIHEEKFRAIDGISSVLPVWML